MTLITSQLQSLSLIPIREKMRMRKVTIKETFLSLLRRAEIRSTIFQVATTENRRLKSSRRKMVIVEILTLKK